MNLGRYIRTVRHLKWRQIYYRIYYKFKKPKIPCIDFNVTQIKISHAHQPWQQVTPHDNIVKAENYFCFLNETKSIAEQSIWHDSNIAKLWLYNLHYFNYLFAPDKQLSLNEKLKLIRRWINENPSANSVSFEPYPTSLRIVNWIKYLLINPLQDAEIFQSLFKQSQLLNSRLEYHILGNHLLANAKALLFAGLFFQGKEAIKLYQNGLSIYMKEIKEQIAKDGGHFELSPMYHAIVLEDVLDIIQIHHLFNQPLNPMIAATAARMLAWLQGVTHPDGEPAFFNDTSIGIAPTYKQLQQYAQLLCLQIPDAYEEGLFQTKTYCTFKDKEIMIVCDIGNIGPDYLPGHAHADTLSFELSLRGYRVFVNSGISCYEKNKNRQFQRSTAAHNTLVINQKNSSEVWDSFRVGRRAKINCVNIVNNQYNHRMSAQHNGYKHLCNIIHERTWHIKNKELHIIDHITGKPFMTAHMDAFFHFHPHIHLQPISRRQVEIYLFYNKIGLLETDHDIQVNHSYYHPTFGQTIPNLTIKTTAISQLPHTLNTQFFWL